MSNLYTESAVRHDLHKVWNDRAKEAYLYTKLDSGRVRCRLCPRSCEIPPGGVGFCKVRKNIDGTLYAQSYGKATHITIERIETEAIHHFRPGGKILSLGNFGCNLDCDYCQNWMYSQFQYTAPETIHSYSTDQVIQMAKANNVNILSWTYNDPAVWFEFVIDTAREAKKHGLLNLFKSAFFLSHEAVEELSRVIDVFAISIKAMDEEYYKRFTRGWLAPVLENTRFIHRSGIHYELSNLVVTGLTNNIQNYDKMIDFILDDLSPDTPIHFTRFHPDYKYMHVAKTPVSDVMEARKRALDRGIRFAYVGNAFNCEGLNTYCPGCGELLIERFGLNTYAKPTLGPDGGCRKCGLALPIRSIDPADLQGEAIPV
ncbi:MAG TPA: AmmeMemoRadiSam system radical SAM enzyme [Candidatus Ozemobacteraceae bacterium]